MSGAGAARRGAPGWPLPVPARTGAAERRAARAGRVAVITGASRGLGAGMAAHLAAEGLHLALCARHRPDLVAATRPRAHDGRIDPPEPPLCASVDVSVAGAVADFADAVVARFGRIDLWVNNAAVLGPVAPLAEADPEALVRHVEVNVTGVLLGSRAFARHVAARPGGGVLVNVSSGAARRPYRGWAAYCAGKAAVEMATEVLAAEAADAGTGLRAYAVAPGVVDTDMQAAVRAADPADFPDVEDFRALGRAGAFNSPAWVAERLLDLAFGGRPVDGVCLRVPDEPRRAAR